MSKFSKTLTLDEATRLDVASSTVTYIGKALPNSATNAAVWKITKLTSNAEGDLTIEYVTGSPVYTSIWDDRISLSYS